MANEKECKRKKKQLLKKLMEIAGVKKIECKKMELPVSRDSGYGFFARCSMDGPDRKMLLFDSETRPITACCKLPAESLVDLALERFHHGATMIYFFKYKKSCRSMWTYPKILVPYVSSLEELEIWADLQIGLSKSLETSL